MTRQEQDLDADQLCLVVPCYDEAKRLNVRDFADFLSSHPRASILFVDDGSTDKTYNVLMDLRSVNPKQVTVLRMARNSGKAEAVRAGMNQAINRKQYGFVGYWDADLATPLWSVPAFATILQSRPEIEMVFGARVKLCGRQIERQPARHYLGRVFATAVSMMLRLPIYDTQCGAKLFRVREESSFIFAEPFASKWIFDVEILARFLQSRSPQVLESQIYEYPLEKWTDVAGSKVKPTDFLKALLEIVTIRKKYLRNRRRN